MNVEFVTFSILPHTSMPIWIETCHRNLFECIESNALLDFSSKLITVSEYVVCFNRRKTVLLYLFATYFNRTPLGKKYTSNTKKETNAFAFHLATNCAVGNHWQFPSRVSAGSSLICIIREELAAVALNI